MNVELLPHYDGDSVGWEPTEPWWDRGYWAWVRDIWGRMLPVPAKRNARRYGK